MVAPGGPSEPGRSIVAGWGGRLADWILGSRLALPGLLLAGFVIVFAVLLRDRILPAEEVVAQPVVALRAEAGAAPDDTEAVADAADPAPGTDAAAPGGAPDDRPPARGAQLFQASGWVEPDPLPIKVPALVGGVVDSVHVLEGQAVKKGDVIASLIRDDVELDLREARSASALIQAECDAHLARIPAAQAEIEAKRREVDLERAKLAELDDLAQRFQSARTGSVSESEVRQARLKLESQQAMVASVEADLPKLEAELGQLQVIEATFQRKLEEAEVEVARRELALERTNVRAPSDGVVLRLLAVPGQKRMLEMDDLDSATVAILYDPEHLQARVDVPLADAAGLFVGQPALITSDLLPDAEFEGVVTRIVGEADVARNTLQAKVRIFAPDARLRPEMLCRVKFFAAGPGDRPAAGTAATPPGSAGATPETAGPGRLVVYVPETALIERTGNSAAVWIVGTGQRAEHRTVTLRPGVVRDDHVAVAEGLRPGDRVITSRHDSLEPGVRLRLLPPDSNES